MEKVSIIIPAYNEGKRIKKTLEVYSSYFNKLKKEKKTDYEILVVINNTTDNTEKIVKESIKKNKKIDYLNLKEGGKGIAIIEGFKDALKRKNSLIGFVDADMSTPPEAFYDLVRNIEGYGGIIANRWSPYSKILTKQSAFRRIMSRGFNILVRGILFLNFEDTQCGAKLFKREVINSVIKDLGITKWGFDIDLLYRLKKKGFKINEIPTIWEDKGGSKINIIRSPIGMFISIVRLRIIYSPFKPFIRVYDRLSKSIKTAN